MKVRIPLFIALAFMALALSAQNSRIFRQVLPGDFLQRAGLTRLSDILAYADEWAFSGTSGMKYQANAGGLDFAPDANWQILVDGQLVFLHHLDVNHLNALPFGVDLIDSVEIYSDPQMTAGYFTGKGLIHIHTRAIRAAAILANNNIGNETGDPGAYAYTRHRTPNVDRLGPNYSFSGDIRVAGMGMRAGFNNQNHYSTDPNILNRQWRLDTEAPRGQILSPFLQATYAAGKIDFRLFYFQSTSAGKYGFSNWGRDFHYFSAFGAELPLQFSLAAFSYQLTYKMSGRFQLYHSLNKSEQKIYRPNARAGEPEPNWHDFKNEYRMGIRYQSGGQNFALFGRYSDKNPEGSGGDPEFSEISFQHRISFSEKFGQDLTISLRPEKSTNFAVLLGEHYSPAPGRRIGLLAYFMKGEKELSQDYWRNIDFIEKGAPVLDASAGNSPLEWGLRLGAFRQIFTNTKIELSTFYRGTKNLLYAGVRYRNGSVYGVRYQWDPRYINAESLTIYSADATAIWGISGGLSHSLNSRINQRIHFYFYRNFAKDDSPILRETDKNPELLMNYTMDYRMAKTFSMIAHVRYLSGTEWRDFSEMQLSASNPAKLPRRLLADLALHKTIWQNRIWANVALNNIFNQEERFHPLGARLNLRWYVQIGLSINSPMGKGN